MRRSASIRGATVVGGSPPIDRQVRSLCARSLGERRGPSVPRTVRMRRPAVRVGHGRWGNSESGEEEFDRDCEREDERMGGDGAMVRLWEVG